MALQKSVISLPMSLGIDTENAAPLIDNQRFAFLSNCVFNKDNNGQLHKRPGHTAMSRAVQGGGLLPAAQLLAIFNDETCAIAGGSLYGYSPTSASWASRGAPPMVQQVETNIAAGAFSVQNPDAVILNGVAYYAYEMNGQSWVKVVDDSNKSVKRTVQLLNLVGAATFGPKLVSNGSNVIAISSSVSTAGGFPTGSIWFTSLNTTTYAPTVTNPGLVADVSAGTSETCLDAQVIGTSLYLAFIHSSNVNVYSFNASTLAFIANANAGASNPAPSPVSCAALGTSLAVTWQLTGLTFKTQTYTSSALSAGATSYTFGSSGTAAAPRLATAGITAGSGNYLVVFYEQAPVSPNVLSSIYLVIIQSSASTPQLWSTGTNISGLPFQQGTASPVIYLPVIYPSTVQQTLFLTYQALFPATPGLASVAGRYFSSNDSGSAPSNFRIPQSFVNGSVQCLPVVVQPQGTSASSVSASLSELSLSFSVALNSAQLGGNQHLALGSMLMDYDGTNLVEHNFHLFPETPTVSYLSSQLTVIVDEYDPTCGTIGGSQGSFRLAIPDNGENPGGPAGQLITPGEYITFAAGSINFNAHTGPPQGYAPIVFYFRVAGLPSVAPIITGSPTVIPIDITAQMTSTQIATQVFNALDLYLTATYVVTYTPTTQAVASGAYVWTPQMIGLMSIAQAGADASAIYPPVLSRISTAAQVYIGNVVTSTDLLVGLSFPPAGLISSGQYATFSIPNFAATSYSMVYFWFSNPTNATIGNENLTSGDPKPFGNLSNSATVGIYPITYDGTAGAFLGSHIGVQVALLGNETEQQVATMVGSAFNALRTQATSPGPFFPVSAAITQTANALIIQSTYVTGSGGITVPVANYPTTNVGQGYVGGIVDGVSGLVAINYSAVQEWIDSQNQLHQSAPSIPATAYIPTYVNLSLVAQPVSAVVQLAIQPLSLTLKTSALTGTDLDIAIYRTISGATVGNQVYYRVTPTSAPLFNQPSSLTALPYADYSSDLGVQANQLMYTTGGVQPNAAPPACSYILNHQNRLWLSGLENPNELWYSETWDSGFGVNFSSQQQVLINPLVGPAVGGPIIALASMDSNLIIFQENQIWYIQGYGPDPTGGNGFFTPPQIIASSSQIGCRDPQSVVLMPNGVMFKSTQGFWLLGRDLQLRYIGAAVKTYNSDITLGAIALANNSQINFLSSSGTTLMYDWYYDSWSTFTTQGLDSVLDASGTFNFVTNSGQIWVQTVGQYIDGDGSPVIMSITTAWLKPQNVQGFQRIWRILLEGQFYGSQPYLVQIAYNYNTTIVDTFPYNNGAGGTTIGDWGGSATWGEFIWGEDSAGLPTSYPDSIQVRIDNSNQLCESLQLTISDFPPVPVSQTWALNALDLVIGVRSGSFKRIGPPQSIG
jgi:hypothetical protein